MNDQNSAAIDTGGHSQQNPDDPRADGGGAPLKVMVVDDTTVNRQILKVFLERLDFVCLSASDGDEALEVFLRDPPDIILMDVMMPQVNGYDATRRIRENSGDRWVPVIFISALDRNDNLIDGLEAGGDDFMSKPINFIVLDAKLRSLRRMVELQRKLEESREVLRDNAERLQAYRDHQESEHAFAREIIQRQMGRPGLADASVHHWVAPAEDFSGDIVAATRDADGKLYAMLADSAGHGLAPAISVVPVLTMFYSMIEGGRPPSPGHIIGELNRQLLATLPRGRFVAGALFCVDEKRRTADIWVGGIPALFWLGGDGLLRRVFESSHISLGIIDTDEDLLTLEHVEWTPGDRFIVCSDGLLESQLAGSEEGFGVDRFVQVLESCPRGHDLMRHIRDELVRLIGAAPPADDISVLIIDTPTS